MSGVNEKSLPVIQGLWIGDELSTMEQLSIASFLYNGHPFHLYLYDDVRNMPDGVVIKDANDILDDSLIFKYRDRDTYAGFANLFRYKLLYDKGGYWVDMDVVCVKPFNFPNSYVFNTETTGANCDIGNCVIKAPEGSSLMRYCYETILGCGNLKQTKWGETGPLFFREIVQKFNLVNYAVDAEVFCPVPYNKFEDFIRKSSHEILTPVTHKVRGVHLWSEMWRLSNMDKNAQYTDNCFYEELKAKLLSA